MPLSLSVPTELSGAILLSHSPPSPELLALTALQQEAQEEVHPPHSRLRTPSTGQQKWANALPGQLEGASRLGSEPGVRKQSCLSPVVHTPMQASTWTVRLAPTPVGTWLA